MKLDLHPIRATIALVSILATVAMLFVGISAPDAWWLAFGAVIGFYFGTQ